MKKLSGVVLILMFALFLTNCEAVNNTDKEAKEEKLQPMASDTTLTSEAPILPDTESLKEGKILVEDRLDSLLTLIEQKEASLLDREKTLLDREKQLYAKSASLDERSERINTFRTVSWFICAIGLVTFVFGIVFFQRSKNKMVAPEPETKKKGANKATTAKKAKDNAEALKKEFITAAEVEMKEWQKQIDQLKTKAGKAKDDVKEEYNKQVGELEKDLENFKKKVNESKKSSGESWESLKEGMEKAQKELKKAVDDASKKIK